MSLTRPLPLGWRDAPLLVEALATLALASVAIRLLPFRRVAGLAGSKQGQTADDVAKVRQAIDAWARRVPWKTVCFQRGLALHMMARRRGIASVLHYGVAQLPAKGPLPDKALAAHVWVEVDGRTVIGGEEAPRFARLASFPAAAVP